MVLINTPIFSQAWVDLYSPTPELAMVATIKIVDPGTGTSTWNPVTDQWTTTATELYSGKARVQPIGTQSLKTVPGDAANVINVRVQIPVANISLSLRPELQMLVTSAPLNPDLRAYEFYITEGLDSSNPLEKTFHCTTNLKTVRAVL